jgi:hypothetical protein
LPGLEWKARWRHRAFFLHHRGAEDAEEGDGIEDWVIW